MAGPTPLRLDPAYEKYGQLNKERWKYFKWTPRTAWISFMYAIFVPTVVGYTFAKTDVSDDTVVCVPYIASMMDVTADTYPFESQGKWNMRGKLRGDTISEF
ncbi:hypothetical protein LTR67_004415 [Exophiala xenobiotica]